MAYLRLAQQAGEADCTKDAPPLLFVDGCVKLTWALYRIVHDRLTCLFRRFLLFCDERYLPLYDIKIFLPISKETCKQRRLRCHTPTQQGAMKNSPSCSFHACSRDPGTSEDYFERIIWPSYCKWNSYPLERWEEIKRSRPSSELHPLTGHNGGDDGIFFINGEINKDQVFHLAVRYIDMCLLKHHPFQ